MRNIKYIAIHCSAGFSLIPAIENFWYKVNKWKSPGYHIIIYEDGTSWYLGSDLKYHSDPSKLDLSKITNGVLGFNTESVHICYIGGVSKNNVNVAKDTRTDSQKKAIIDAIKLVQGILSSKGQDPSKIKIQGHRDFSPDKNGNGVVDSWERIKECPSFDAIPEYKSLIPTTGNRVGYTLADLNLRSGPGTDFCKNGKPIPKGQSLQVTYSESGWSKVITSDGRSGFVSSKYLR